MELVKITPLGLIGENEKGSTLEFKSSSPSKGRILVFRKKGSISGNHWHKGLSPAKDPEELLLISGQIRLSVKAAETTQALEERVVSGPSLIHIPKNVYHRVEALSDVSFLESNSMEEHASDTFYED